VVAASIVPAVLVALLLVGYDYYDRERERLARDALSTARALSAAVDKDLAGVTAALRALSTSPHLTSGNLAAFHAQALDAMQEQSFVNIILTDASGRQLLNTFRRFGEPLPTQGDPGGLLRTFKTGAAVISDLFQGRLTQSLIIGIGVPVKRDGAVLYGLNAGLSPERLSALVGSQKLPPGWIAGVFDRQGVIVARTHDAGRLVGQRGSPALVQRMAQVGEDAFESRTVEGIEVLTVFSRSAVSGWTVAIGIPIEELRAHLWFSLARLFVAGFIAVLVGMGIALLFGRRLVR
jgi:hypothetical protein